MKKLVSLIAVGTLGVTGASRLKPLFANNITNIFKSNSKTKDIGISSDNENPFISKLTVAKYTTGISNIAVAPDGTIYTIAASGLFKSNNGKFTKIILPIAAGRPSVIVIAANGAIYVGADDGLYVSDDGVTYNKINKINKRVSTLAVAVNGTIYVGTYIDEIHGDLYKIDLTKKLLNLKRPDYYGNKYNGLVYNKETKIDIEDTYLSDATLDGQTQSLPKKDLILNDGKHILILTLKDKYKKYLNLFCGNIITGQITYNLWVKTKINSNEINYTINKDNTKLLVGKISDSGNTIGSQIIQTKSKDATGTHDASISNELKDTLIDFHNSYYVLGTVDEETNNFIKSGSNQKLQKNTEIKTDGTYHLHLVDMVGSTYDSYLELGEKNWKLKGQFNNDKLNKLAADLNVKIDLTNTNLKQEALGWLQNYQSDIANAFIETVKSKGKEFSIVFDDLKDGFKSFLNYIKYVDSNTKQDINQIELDSLISTIANQKLQDSLSKLPQGLNVNTNNVVNKSTLETYTNWIKEYDNFVNSTKDQWINDAFALASCGFASDEEAQSIKDHIENLKFSDYLENIIWTSNNNTLGYRTISNNFLQHIKLDKFNKDVIEWTNNNWPDINKAYESALKGAESGLNLHGYDINSLLDDKPLPKTKGEIDNFANGASFHDYLQTQANNKFHRWQLQMGLEIGLPLLLIVAGIGIIISWRTSPRHNPLARTRKDEVRGFPVICVT